MGRSEAPLHRDYREAIPGGANRKLSSAVLSRIAFIKPEAGDTRAALPTERLRGVDYKYNRQGGGWLWTRPPTQPVTQFRLLSLEPPKNPI